MAWKEVGFVLRSDQRKHIILLLKSPKTPSQIAKILKINISNISLKLIDLEKQGIIECVNPKEKKGRIYALTKTGKDVLKKLEEMEK